MLKWFLTPDLHDPRVSNSGNLVACVWMCQLSHVRSERHYSSTSSTDKFTSVRFQGWDLSLLCSTETALWRKIIFLHIESALYLFTVDTDGFLKQVACKVIHDVTHTVKQRWGTRVTGLHLSLTQAATLRTWDYHWSKTRLDFELDLMTWDWTWTLSSRVFYSSPRRNCSFYSCIMSFILTF